MLQTMVEYGYCRSWKLTAVETHNNCNGMLLINAVLLSTVTDVVLLSTVTTLLINIANDYILSACVCLTYDS